MRVILHLMLILVSSPIWAAENDVYFDSASILNGRGSSIGSTMSKYKSATKESGPKQRQADLALLWSIAETGSMCAILGGNLVGALGMMDAVNRFRFMEMVLVSVSGCRQFISEKLVFLEVLPQVRSDVASSQFAEELANHLRSLDEEFDDFLSR